MHAELELHRLSKNLYSGWYTGWNLANLTIKGLTQHYASVIYLNFSLNNQLDAQQRSFGLSRFDIIQSDVGQIRIIESYWT